MKECTNEGMHQLGKVLEEECMDERVPLFFLQLRSRFYSRVLVSLIGKGRPSSRFEPPPPVLPPTRVPPTIDYLIAGSGHFWLVPSCLPFFFRTHDPSSPIFFYPRERVASDNANCSHLQSKGQSESPWDFHFTGTFTLTFFFTAEAQKNALHVGHHE